jgi:hypothetical protein
MSDDILEDNTNPQLSVSESTIKRFEEKRMETKNELVPEMNQDAFLNSLLDTVEAVERGYYGE